jgi:hypothetical protein
MGAPADTTTAASSARSGALAVFAGVTALMALVQLLCLGSSLAGVVVTPVVAWVLIAVALVAAGLFASRFWSPRPIPRTPAASVTEPITKVSTTLIIAVLLAWAAGLWARLWHLALLRPPYDWDGLYYHLPAINAWVRQGHVGWIDTIPDIPFVNVPMGVEVSSFLVHQATGTSRLVDACNLLYWPLAFTALVVVAAALGVRGVWRWLAGALMVGAPVFLSQSVSCYIDPGFSSTVMAAVAASLILIFAAEHAAWRAALLWGAALGLMAGSKGTGAPFTLVLFTVVTVLVAVQSGFKRVRVWALRLCVAGTVALAVGGYWYVRGAVNTGNPIYPVQLRIGGKILKQGYDPQLFLSDNMPEWLAAYPAPLRLPVSWLQLDAPIHGYAPTGGLGFLWIFGCVPAIAVAAGLSWRGRRSPFARRFAALAILTTALLVVQPSPWWARLTIWLYVLGAPCLAFVLSEAAANRRPILKLAVVVGLLAVGSVVIWESQRTLILEQETGKSREPVDPAVRYVATSEYIFPGLSSLAGYDGFHDAPTIARSNWSRLGTLLGGILAMPLGARKIEVLPAAAAADDVEALQSRGVEWICWDGVIAGEVPRPLTDAATRVFRYHPDADTDFTFLEIAKPDVGQAAQRYDHRGEGSG